MVIHRTSPGGDDRLFCMEGADHPTLDFTQNQIAFLIGLLLFFFAALATIYLVEGSLFNLYSLLLFVFSFSTGFSIFAYFDALKDRAERMQERSQEDAPELELPPLKEQLYEEKDLV